MIEDELPASEVEHAVLHEVPGPVLAAGAVGRIEVEGDTVLVRGDLQVLMWTLWTILFFEESGTATIISKAGIFDVWVWWTDPTVESLSSAFHFESGKFVAF